jgi:hypothetical protein
MSAEKRKLTIAEAATLMGVHRTSAYRQLRAHLEWGLHKGQRCRVVSLDRVRAAALPHLAEAEWRGLLRRIELLEKKLAEREAGPKGRQ